MVQCYPGLDFNFSLFCLFVSLFFLMYDNEIVTKESKILTKGKESTTTLVQSNCVPVTAI